MNHSSHTKITQTTLAETFSQSGFMPHGHCYLWKPLLVSIHVISDTLIGLAYVAISITLYFLVKKIQLPFNRVVLFFGVFIGACGLTHFMEVWNLWNADYWVGAWIKVITAIASVGTGIYLFRLRHAIVQVAEAAKLAEQRRLDLEVLTTDLEKRVEERTKKLQESESKLRESEEQFRTFANSIPQLAWVASGDGQITWFNKRWYDYTGLTIDQNDKWPSVHDPKELPRVMEEWKKTLESGEPSEMEFPIKNAHGQFRWFLTQMVPMKNEKGEIIRWFGTNTDIDEQKKIRQELQKSINDRDEFISIASHEMKTPLTSMKMQFDITKMNFKKSNYKSLDPEKLEKMFEVTDRQIGRLTGLIEDMLDVSRVSFGNLPIERENVNLNKLIYAVIDKIALQLKQSKNTVHVTADKEIIGFWDYSRLEQVITNILMNSTKYSAGTDIAIDLSLNKDNACIKIRDYGMGIPKEMQNKIFSRFERAVSANNISGMGLGLYITKEILNRHHGTIKVESELGQGALFIIELPLGDKDDL